VRHEDGIIAQNKRGTK